MKKLKYLIVLSLALGFYTCADLEELAPINSIPASSAINNFATAKAAVNGIYDQYQNTDLVFDGYLALPQFFTDEANATGTFPTRLEFGNLNVFPANITSARVFSELYELINVANNVIEGVPGVTDESFSAEAKSDFIAQAKFARAHAYLHLVELYGDIPLVTTPTREIGENLNFSKSSKADIYALIKADFTEASTNLAAQAGPLEASKQAADAFLARVALYEGDWSRALSMAQGVLGEVDLTTVPYLEDQIFTLGFTPTDGNNLNFFYGAESLGGRYSIGPTTTLINAYEFADSIRFRATLDTMSAAVPYGVKYPSFSAGSTGTATDPIYFIRHSEMVLIAAEAAAEMGDFGTASMYLNQVRTRAGLEDVTLDANNFVDMILQERFVEFAFEGPFRLIDLRRKGKAMEVLGPLGYDSCDDVWPLPQRDVDRNINLDQNDCCNC